MTPAVLYHFSEDPSITRFVPYRYEFEPHGFVPWEEAHGQWIAERDIIPTDVSAMGDLLAAHAAAGIELRIVPSLWPLHDIAVGGEFDFSMVRMRNAHMVALLRLR